MMMMMMVMMVMMMMMTFLFNSCLPSVVLALGAPLASLASNFQALSLAFVELEDLGHFVVPMPRDKALGVPSPLGDPRFKCPQDVLGNLLVIVERLPASSEPSSESRESFLGVARQLSCILVFAFLDPCPCLRLAAAAHCLPVGGLANVTN